jgi:hypothetical protein
MAHLGMTGIHKLPDFVEGMPQVDDGDWSFQQRQRMELPIEELNSEVRLARPPRPIVSPHAGGGAS